MTNPTSDNAADIIERLAAVDRKPVVQWDRNAPGFPDLLLFVLRASDGSERTEVVDLAKYLPTPLTKTGTPVTYDAESFGRYVNRHKTSDRTTLWGDVQRSAVVGVLDDHPDTSVGTGRAAHRVTLELRQTPSWLAWLGNNGVLNSQDAFAEFLEDNASDIVNPSAADMLEVAQTFKVNSGVRFSSARSIANGQVQLEYTEDRTERAGKSGDIEVPQRFTVRLQPFRGGTTYDVDARFRYRLNQGELAMGYRLTQPTAVLEMAFQDVLGSIEHETGLSVFAGAAPAAR